MNKKDVQDEVINLTELKMMLKNFAQARDWEKFHTPKNLAMALSVESSELVELFQWLSDSESQSLPKLGGNPELRKNVEREMADIFVYLMRMATVLDINLPQAVQDKMLENNKKYPAEKVKGQAKKYTEY